MFITRKTPVFSRLCNPQPPVHNPRKLLTDFREKNPKQVMHRKVLNNEQALSVLYRRDSILEEMSRMLSRRPLEGLVSSFSTRLQAYRTVV